MAFDRRSLLTLGGAVLAGCAAPRRERSTPQPATTIDASPLASRWTTDLPGQFTLASPAIGTQLYVASRREVFALDLADGGHRWRQNLGALSHGFPPVVTDGIVLSGARDLIHGRRSIDRGGTPGLIAISESGDLTWDVDFPIGASPTVVGANVVVPETDGRHAWVRAFDLATGTDRWRRPVDAMAAFTRPVTDGTNVFLVVRDRYRSYLLSLTPEGEVRWRDRLPGKCHQGPSVGNNRVTIGTEDGAVVTYGTGGSEWWRAHLDAPMYTSPIAVGEWTFAATPDRVVAFGPDGNRRWGAAIGDIGKTGLAVVDGVVHVGGDDIAGIDAMTGTVRWRVAIPGLAGTFGAPVVKDGVLYTGACIKTDGNGRYDHAVYAFDLPTQSRHRS